jgi:hypothetical protein
VRSTRKARPWQRSLRWQWWTAAAGNRRMADSDDGDQCERFRELCKDETNLVVEGIGRRWRSRGEFRRHVEVVSGGAEGGIEGDSRRQGLLTARTKLLPLPALACTCH